MAEYIEREKALEECDWYANEFCECEYAIMPLKGALENIPAADVRPVVVCRDCLLRQYCKVAQYLGEDGFNCDCETRVDFLKHTMDCINKAPVVIPSDMPTYEEEGEA